MVFAESVGPLLDAADHWGVAPDDVCEGRLAPLETGIGILGDDRDFVWHPQSAPGEKLLGGEDDGGFVEEQRGGWGGVEEGSEKRMQACWGFLPVWEDEPLPCRAALCGQFCEEGAGEG